MPSRAFLLLLSAAALSGQSPLSVCDVLQRLDELHGKPVTIKARYRAGEEFVSLYDQACPGPVLVDQVKRAAGISPAFHLSEVENKRTRPLFTDALDEGKAIELTVEGEFRSQQPGSIIRNPDGTERWARIFGHMGAYPAELKITRIIHFHAFNDPKDHAWWGPSREQDRQLAAAKDICTVFHNLPHWHGRTVAIRGRYRYSRELAGLYGTDCPELRAAIDIEPALPPAELAKINAIVEKTKQDGSAIDAIFLGHFTRQTGPVGFGHLGVYPAKLRVTQVLRFQSIADIFHPANMGR